VAIGDLLRETDSTRTWGQRVGAVLETVEHRPWLCRVTLTVWCGLLFFYGLNAGQFWKTEGLRALVAAECLRSGNWIVPTLYGEPLFTKPPGMYVAIILCSLPFGAVHEWTARLPSALAAMLTVLLLYGHFKHCFGRLGGMVAAIVVPMAPLWLDKASAAEIDMMQVMWVSGAMVCLLRAVEAAAGERGASAPCFPGDRGALVPYFPKQQGADAPRSPAAGDFLWWLGALLCVAGGVLTKWTAPAFFYASAIPLLWRRGQLRLLFGWRHLLAALIGASICVAWVGAVVALEGWDLFYLTVKREALQRMLPDHAPTVDPWYLFALHPFRLWYNNLPWSLVALLACRPAFGQLWDRRGRLLWQALHCWLWPNMLIWSLMLDHKARHSFPLFPAFGGLAAMVWIAWLTGRLRWRFSTPPRRILVLAMAVWLILKAVYLEIAIARNDRDPQGKAALLSSLVPVGSSLYLFQIKDEGIMFYYGRRVLRLASPADLPSSAEPLYCILAKEEWRTWSTRSHRRAVALSDGMVDEQGAEMVLVRVMP
jgi:4-amino-4-deoxy-L-arabinose transferase-like glycosyltransferase